MLCITQLHLHQRWHYIWRFSTLFSITPEVTRCHKK
jgi:hypothetical protein